VPVKADGRYWAVYEERLPDTPTARAAMDDAALAVTSSRARLNCDSGPLVVSVVCEIPWP
jgi:hypothetical protein